VCGAWPVRGGVCGVVRSYFGSNLAHSGCDLGATQQLTEEQIAGEPQAAQTATALGATTPDQQLTKQQMAGEPQALQVAARKRVPPKAPPPEYLAFVMKEQIESVEPVEKSTKEQMAGEPQALQTASSASSRWANFENRMEFERKALQLVAKQVARDIASASNRMESIEKLTKEQMSGELLKLIQASDEAFEEAVEKSSRIVESMEKLTKEQLQPGRRR